MIASITLYSILRWPTFLELMDGRSVDEQVFESGELFLDSREARFFGKEHSERKTLSGTATQLCIPKLDRDFLGRWVPEQPGDYLLAARSVVVGYQEKVAKQIRVTPTLINETEILDAIRKHLLGNGLGELEAVSFFRRFRLGMLSLGQLFGSNPISGSDELAIIQSFYLFPCEEFGESMSR
jgi:hypothetical protein